MSGVNLSYLYELVALKRACLFLVMWRWSDCLTSESVQSAALSFQSIDDIHGGDSLPLGVFGVGDSVPDNILKEHLEHSTGLLVDQARDTLDTTTTRQTANGGLGDTLDVITQDFAMTLSATLSESFSSFSTSRHDDSSMNE